MNLLKTNKIIKVIIFDTFFEKVYRKNLVFFRSVRRGKSKNFTLPLPSRKRSFRGFLRGLPLNPHTTCNVVTGCIVGRNHKE